MARRGNSEDSVYQRACDKRWVAATWLANGKRKYFYAWTRSEVVSKLGSWKKSYRSELYGGEQRVDDYLDRWIKGLATRKELAPATIFKYSVSVRYIKPHIGKLRMSKVRREHLQRTLDDLTGEPATIRFHYAAMHRAFNDAVDDEIIDSSPAHRLRLPKSSKFPIIPLNAEQVAQLLEVSEGTKWHALWAVLVTCGLRYGEAQALRWGDIDGTDFIISRSCRFKTTLDFEFAEPKTTSGRRRVPIPLSTLNALNLHKNMQNEMRLRAMVWQDLGLIFTTEIGTPLPGNTTHTHFHRHLAEAGLPHIRIHDLRHTFATLLFGLGVHSGYVQHALGHSSASFTQDIYSHYLPEMGVAVSDAMDSILEAGKGRSAVNRAVQEPVNLRSAAKSQGKHT